VVDDDAVNAALSRWQKVLRLGDWDLTVRMAPPDWRKSADVKVDLEDRKAVLIVNREPRSDNLEELVVHELLHVRLYALDQMIEDLLAAVYGQDGLDPRRSFAYAQFMRVLESTVEDLAKGYLAAAGAREPLSFGRLREAVRRELEPDE
jgi:hypothetical protein